MATAVITDLNSHKAKNIYEVDYSKTTITDLVRNTVINSVLPFRVKFETIGVAPAYANVPGIGLQIIGLNNYIL